MFGEDAQSKWTTLDEMKLSEKSQYLMYSSSKSSAEIKLANSITQNNIKFTERTSYKNNSGKVSAKELDEIALWIQHLSQTETKGIEDKPKVEVKKK